MKQRLVLVLLAVAAVLLIGPFLIPLPRQPDLAPEEIPLTGALEGGRFITIDGYQTFVIDAGPRDGRVVVLIHGFGGSTFSWRDTIPALVNSGYRAIALDLKGFGLSEKAYQGDYAHPAQAEFVAALLDQLEVEQAVIAGHSMGANVLVHFALMYPDRVEKLVIVDGAVVTGEGGQAGFGRGGWLVKIPQVRRLARIFARSLLSEKQIRDMLESAVYDPAILTSQMVNGYYTPLTIKDWDQALLGIVRDAGRNRLPEPLSHVTAPTLIIWGEDDTWVAPENGRLLLEALPDAELITIPETGHLPMEERPGIFNTHLLAFLENSSDGG